MRRIFDLRALAVLFGKRPKAGGTEIGTNDGFRDWNSFEAGLSLRAGFGDAGFGRAGFCMGKGCWDLRGSG